MLKDSTGSKDPAKGWPEMREEATRPRNVTSWLVVNAEGEAGNEEA